MIDAQALRNQAKGLAAVDQGHTLRHRECVILSSLILAEKLEELTQAITKVSQDLNETIALQKLLAVT